jgi:hypothetical protein
MRSPLNNITRYWGSSAVLFACVDRDGGELFECVKGDQYVLDQKLNKGHTAQGNCGAWHPKVEGIMSHTQGLSEVISILN